MRKKFAKNLPGFTMIELLIVMALMAALATLFVTTYPNVLQKGRDTERQSDLKQYQTALELYGNKKNGTYPIKTVPVDISEATGMCATLGMANCPPDPKNGDTTACSSSECRYWYISNANGTSYSVWATLEKPQDASKPLIVNCSNGKTGFTATSPTSVSTCPI